MDINLYIIYKTLIGGQKIQINRKIRIESPIPPQITIKKIEQKNYDMKNKTSDAVLKIEIVNNGRNIDLQLNSINYKLQIKNNLFSKGIFAGPIHIRPASSLTVDIPITIEYNNPLKTAWVIFTDNDILHYDLNVQTDVTLNIFKTLFMIPVEVDATGNMELVK